MIARPIDSEKLSSTCEYNTVCLFELKIQCNLFEKDLLFVPSSLYSLENFSPLLAIFDAIINMDAIINIDLVGALYCIFRVKSLGSSWGFRF